MNFVWFVLFSIIGKGYYSFSFIQILMTIFCSLPMTRKLRKLGALKDDAMNKVNAATMLIHFFLGVLICTPIFLFASWFMISGFLFGMILALFLSVGKLGMTKDNVEDYLKAHSVHIDFNIFDGHDNGYFGLKKISDDNFISNSSNAYKCLNSAYVKDFLPEGIAQARKIIISVSKIINEDYKKYDEAKCSKILSIYIAVFTRKKIMGYDDEFLENSLLVNNEDIINKENVKKILAYVTINITNYGFELENSDDFEALDMMTDYSNRREEDTKKNKDMLSENIDNKEYGMVSNKPIYTKGVTGSQEYLSKLRTGWGEKLTWERKGSLSIDGINGMIDEYEMYLSSGELYVKLYLNIYSRANSNYAPRGFTIEQ